MPPSVLDSLATVAPEMGRPLSLRRVWARSADHLVLEYVDTDDRPVAAQWHRDERALQRMLDGVRRAAPDVSGVGIVRSASTTVLLQPGGADATLVELATLAARPDATLVSHYPDRRAVVRMDGTEGRRFVKAVRPSRLYGALQAHSFLEEMPGRRFSVPRVLDSDEERGRLTLEELGGVSLHQLATSDEEAFIAALAETGAALRSLHDGEPPAWDSIDARGPRAPTPHARSA